MTELKEATLSELVEYHNELAKKAGAKTVKKFASKPKALKAIEALEARKGQIDWPYSGKVQHKVRDSGLRGQILKALRKGSTMNALIKIMEEHDVAAHGKPQDNAQGRVRGTMRTLHRYNGYGVRQDGNRFHLVEK